jgi:endonuclease-3
MNMGMGMGAGVGAGSEGGGVEKTTETTGTTGTTGTDGMKKESLAEKRERAGKIFAALGKEYPGAGCELASWSTPFELAVATMLSAQCTDKRVNMVTPGLFKRYPSVAAFAESGQEELEEVIRSTGFFRNKAKNIRALAARVRDEFGGELPGDFEVLVTLPGIGRKTAHLLVAEAFGGAGLVVDTHFIRLSNRLGFAQGTDARKVEDALVQVVPRERWSRWSHLMVFHGRRCCNARKPECGRCVIAGLCPAKGEGEEKTNKRGAEAPRTPRRGAKAGGAKRGAGRK